jgi:hypothetical protein
MTTIDAELVGKHGTFTNGDQRIIGTIDGVFPANLAILIDGGNRVHTTWLPRDNWDFTPDPAPHPPENGVYTLASHDLDDGPVLAVLYNGHWRVSLVGSGTPADPDALVRDWHENFGLVRLVREDSNA